MAKPRRGPSEEDLLLLLLFLIGATAIVGAMAVSVGASVLDVAIESTSPTPSPTPVQPVADVRIISLDCYSDPEVVTIRNSGTAAQDLTGWELRSSSGVDPAFNLTIVASLDPDEEITVFSGTDAPPEDDRVAGKYAWSERVQFRDAPSVVAQIVDEAGIEVAEMICGEEPTTSAPTSPEPPGLPDLVTTLMITGAATVNDEGGIEVPILVVVTNQGDTAAAIFKVATEYTRDNINSESSFAVAFTGVQGQSNISYPYTTAPLAAGDMKDFAGKVTFRPSEQGTTVFLTATADSCRGDEFQPDYCRVEESDEDNNDSNPRLPVALPDITPPETTIDSNPSSFTESHSATFTFSSPEDGSTFECRLDSASFSACTTPKTYTNLDFGEHTFRVRATGAAANTDLTPASYEWTITIL